MIRLWVCPCCRATRERPKNAIRKYQHKLATAKLTGSPKPLRPGTCLRCMKDMRKARSMPSPRKGYRLGLCPEHSTALERAQYKADKSLRQKERRIQYSKEYAERQKKLPKNEKVKKELKHAIAMHRKAETRRKRALTLEKKWSRTIKRLNRRIDKLSVQQENENGNQDQAQ